MWTGSLPFGLTSPRSTRATACIAELAHEYDAMYVGAAGRAAMSYGFLVATSTIGFPVDLGLIEASAKFSVASGAGAWGRRARGPR